MSISYRKNYPIVLSNNALDLREELDFLYLILDHISDNLVVVDENGIVVLINRPYCELLGGVASDFIGRHITDIVGPNTHLHLVAQGKEVKIGYQLTVNGHKMITNQVPVWRDKYIIGAIGFALFSDLQKFKNIYTKIFGKELALRPSSDYWTSKFDISNIMGRGKVMNDYRKMLKRVAKFDVPTMIFGETGAGKELAAHAIHSLSERHNEQMVWVNCASIPNELIETELFGYESGAFTGARQNGKPGKFELAANGTVFLDEIGDMPLMLQSNLLRVLQSGEVIRVGGTTPIRINARIVCATNKSLRDLVRNGKFRLDLYYRINVLEIKVPSLRERGDVVYLAGELIKEIAGELRQPAPILHSHICRQLTKYTWPGNVRELRSVLIRWMVAGKFHINEIDGGEIMEGATKERDWRGQIKDIAKKEIGNALERAGGNKRKAADLLGISRSQLYRILKKQ